MTTIVTCGDCVQVLEEDPSAQLADRVPCSGCGSVGRSFKVNVVSSVRIDSYVGTKLTKVDRDRSLPGKGIVRSYWGTRVGHDGRPVEREALYDPYTDVARERVVYRDTGEVEVDKTESMREKYIREGRWSPPDEVK